VFSRFLHLSGLLHTERAAARQAGIKPSQCLRSARCTQGFLPGCHGGDRIAGKPFRSGEFFKKMRRFCNLCGSLALYLKDQNKNGEDFRIIMVFFNNLKLTGKEDDPET
jgi:hypothetical protein